MKRKTLAAGILTGILMMAVVGCGSKNTTNINAGMEAIASLDYDAALASFEAAKEAGEDTRLLYRGEGIAYMGKTMYSEAVEAFEKALSSSNGVIESMDYDMNYYLATAYFKQGDYDQAIAVYDAILSLHKNEKDALYFRGAAYTAKGDADQAKSNFDAAVALDATDYDRIIDIFCVLNEHGYKEIGQGYLQTAMGNESKKMTNYEKGRISFYLEDYENARTYLEKARDENGYEAVLFLGKTYETLGDNNYAISVYNTYLESNQPNAEVLNQLGLCKLNSGDNEGALQAFEDAMKIENNGMLQTLKMNEIVAYEHLHEYKKAAVLLEGYFKNYPDDTEAQREYTFLKSR